MKIYLDNEKIIEILRLYYNKKNNMKCNVVIDTSVEYEKN